jgi:hypothetical protein
VGLGFATRRTAQPSKRSAECRRHDDVMPPSARRQHRSLCCAVQVREEADYTLRCYERSTWAVSCAHDGEGSVVAGRCCRCFLFGPAFQSATTQFRCSMPLARPHLLCSLHARWGAACHRVTAELHQRWVAQSASSQIDLVYLRQHNTCTPAPYSVHLAILDPRTRHTLLRTSPSCRERAVWRHSTRLCVPPVPGEPRGLAGLEPHSQPRRCGGKGRRAAWAQPRRRRRRRWCRQLAAQDSVCRLLPAKQVPGW